LAHINDYVRAIAPPPPGSAIAYLWYSSKESRVEIRLHVKRGIHRQPIVCVIHKPPKFSPSSGGRRIKLSRIMAYMEFNWRWTSKTTRTGWPRRRAA